MVLLKRTILDEVSEQIDLGNNVHGLDTIGVLLGDNNTGVVLEELVESRQRSVNSNLHKLSLLRGLLIARRSANGKAGGGRSNGIGGELVRVELSEVKHDLLNGSLGVARP